MEGTKKLKSTSFHQYSWSSEVETTWISLIGWHHKTSNLELIKLNMQVVQPLWGAGWPLSLALTVLITSLSFKAEVQGRKSRHVFLSILTWRVLERAMSEGMETFCGQWNLMDTIFQNGQLLLNILKEWPLMDTFGDISWTLFGVRSGGARLSEHCSVPG